MPWMGLSRRYYYQRERVHGRIVYTYYGAGKLAPLVAEIDQIDHERRQQERWEGQMARSEFAELAAAPEDLTLLLEQAQRAAAAALEAAGYHQHKRGEWRKKRATNKNQDQGKSDNA
jgi:hypothetical protein